MKLIERMEAHLLKREYKRALEQNLFLPVSAELSTVLSTVKAWLTFSENDFGKQSRTELLDFIIDVIKEDLRGSISSEIIYAADKAETREWRFALNPFCAWRDDEPVEQISSEGLTVISNPWRSDRFYSSVQHILRSGFHSDWNSFTGVYYPELRMIAVENGRHHALAAAQLGLSGTFKVRVCKLSNLFPYVHTDGKLWFNEQAPTLNHPVMDIRMAILFELARLRFNENS